MHIPCLASWLQNTNRVEEDHGKLKKDLSNSVGDLSHVGRKYMICWYFTFFFVGFSSFFFWRKYLSTSTEDENGSISPD